jgi:CRP-like cAMP-binding protein
MWSKRMGETQRRAGNVGAAVAAFERAIDKYVAAGFLVQAIAVCKLILQIDPANDSAAERLPILQRKSQRLPVTPGPEEPEAVMPARKHKPTSKPISQPDYEIDNPVVMRGSAARTNKRITLPPPRAAFDSVPLSELVPTQARSDSGVTVIALDFDDLELVEPIDVELDGSVDVDMSTIPPRRGPRRATENPLARSALATTPLFSQVAPPALERLIERMSLVELAPEQVLFREGEPGDALYVISEGEVAVDTAGTELARLGPGTFFGEIALVTELPRSATIRATVRTELLAIDRDVVRDAAAEYPEVITVLLRFVRERLVDRVTRTSELFRPFMPEERGDLASWFEFLEVARDVSLVVEGERSDGLYVVIAGTLEVRRGKSRKPIAALAGGDVFGELSLLNHTGASATVISTTRVIALRLPQARFQEVIMTHPQVLAYLGELSAKRSAPTASPEDVVDFHIDLL